MQCGRVAGLTGHMKNDSPSAVEVNNVPNRNISMNVLMYCINSSGLGDHFVTVWRVLLMYIFATDVDTIFSIDS